MQVTVLQKILNACSTFDINKFVKNLSPILEKTCVEYG